MPFWQWRSRVTKAPCLTCDFLYTYVLSLNVPNTSTENNFQTKTVTDNFCRLSFAAMKCPQEQQRLNPTELAQCVPCVRSRKSIPKKQGPFPDPALARLQLEGPRLPLQPAGSLRTLRPAPRAVCFLPYDCKYIHNSSLIRSGFHFRTE